MTTFAPPSSFLTSQGPRPTSGALIQPPPRRRVTLTNRYGNQRRPLPTPASSPPATQHKKKTVRFCSDNDLEHVRLFIKTQTPLAAANDPLPPPKRWEITYPGWPTKWYMYKSLAHPNTTAIKMEHVILNNDKSVLKGRCRVANLAYEKQVVVRYSFDQWQTSREQTAVYGEPIIASTEWDRFTFEIPVPIIDSTTTTTLTCSMALRYQVHDQTFWDNNDGHNYQVQLTSSAPTTIVDEEEDHGYFSCHSPKLQFRSPPPPASFNTGYDDFISKYCFYNSSILQN